MISTEEINIILSKLAGLFYLKKIILFGSQAYGSSTENSDIDICVITDTNKKKLEVSREIRLVLTPVINKALDILVYNEADFAARSTAKGALEYEIKSKGLILYE